MSPPASTTEASTDLLIVGGRVIDPAGRLDARGAVRIRDGVVVEAPRADAASGADTPSPDARPSPPSQVIDATGMLVLPGLVDFHVHVYEGVSHYGIDADTYCLERGVTHAVDAGSAGAQTFAGFRRFIMEPAATGLHAYLNISTIGMVAPETGELEDPRYLVADKALEVATSHPDEIVGIKLRVGRRNAGHPDVRFALATAKQVAVDAGIPLMVHITNAAVPLEEIMAALGAGDVVTHCFHGQRGGILGSDGKVEGFVRHAIDRGVLLDVGHGRSALDYRVARVALAEGVVPHHVSSDLHTYNAEGPAYDLVTTMAKMLHLGMDLVDIVASVTSRPARAMRREHAIGSIGVGRVADLTVVEIVEGHWDLPDSQGSQERLEHLMVPRWVVRKGVARRLAYSVHEI